MSTLYKDVSIDDYLRKRLMPVEGSIPHLLGIDIPKTGNHCQLRQMNVNAQP